MWSGVYSQIVKRTKIHDKKILLVETLAFFSFSKFGESLFLQGTTWKTDAAYF